ncbi:ABC transporter permease [Acetatifactor aquisgranensis]|uniref:ABC transporter permease n=1 Tax=Acetatifactor aquisgranensis TaxID=2941233 RepID=UPI0038CBFCE0
MFQSVKTVITENWQNRYRLIRLANYELKAQNYGTMFGFLWNFFNPALQIFVYWFVFAIGLRQASPQDDYPYLIWMIAGIIPWFYISGAMQSSATSIYAYSNILKRMRFPLAIVPVKTVLSQFIGHIWALLVIFVVMICAGVRFSLRNLQLIYFMFSGLCFLIALSLLFSSITVLFKDFQKFLSSAIRLLFYITPIVWSQLSLNPTLVFVLKLNPFYYLVEGYRESLLYPHGLLYHWRQMLYFWSITLILFVIGSNMHMKFRKQFIDLL